MTLDLGGMTSVWSAIFFYLVASKSSPQDSSIFEILSLDPVEMKEAAKPDGKAVSEHNKMLLT